MEFIKNKLSKELSKSKIYDFSFNDMQAYIYISFIFKYKSTF